jgi:tetratricopeptide (TPR) repeat protein/TolB-like protein
MRVGMAEREILDSWKEISDYLKRDTRTCQRYERKYGLPVHRLDGSPKARVFAYRTELDAWRTKGLADRHGIIGRLFDSVRSKPAAVAGTLVVMAGAAFLLSGVGKDLFDSRDRLDRLTIALLPFRNISGRPDLDAYALGIPLLITKDLSDSRYFSVLPEDRTTGVLRELGIAPGTAYSSDDLRRIGKISGATHAVLGVLLQDGGELVIALTTRGIGSEEAYSSRFHCPENGDLARTAVRMADQVKRDLGLTRTIEAGDYDSVQMPVTTSSLRAFRLYNDGRRLHVRGEYAAGARIMRKAIARDPEFALAWRSLSASLGSQGDAFEGEKCLRKAVELSRNASAQERYFIRAHYFQARSEFGPALLCTREWHSLYPDDTQANLYMARGLLFEEDMEGARAALEEALRKGDRNPFTFFYASFACTALGRFDEAARVREQGLSVHPGNRLIASAAELEALVRGDWDRALAELGAMARAGEIDSTLALKTGDILLLKGDIEGAGRAYASVRRPSSAAVIRLARLALAEGRYGRAAELAAEAGDDELLAYVEVRSGRPGAGLEAAVRGLQAGIAREHYHSELGALSVKGMIEARSGDLEAARATLSRIRLTGAKGLFRTYQRGVHTLAGIIAGAEGKLERAVEELEAAVALLSMDIPYLDDVPYSIGHVADRHSEILCLAAQAHERVGRQETALDRYHRLIGLTGGRLNHPDLYALSHYAIGRIKQGQGDRAGAREYLTKFLDLWKNADPGLPEVEDAKARLASLVPPSWASSAAVPAR